MGDEGEGVREGEVEEMGEVVMGAEGLERRREARVDGDMRLRVAMLDTRSQKWLSRSAYHLRTSRGIFDITSYFRVP